MKKNTSRYWIVRYLGMRPANLPCYQVNVVIGVGIGTTLDGQNPNGRSQAIVDAAATLHNLRVANNILFVGSAHEPEGKTEAEAMSDYVLNKIDYRAYNTELVCERRPDDDDKHKRVTCNTLKNAQAALRIMKANGWTSAIVIAEAVHANRVLATFRKQFSGHGMSLVIFPTYGNYDRLQLNRLIKEPINMFLSRPLGFFIYNQLATAYSWWKGWM